MALDLDTNVIDLNHARMRRIRVQRKPGEKRAFPRNDAADRLFVQVTDHADAPEYRGLTLSCVTVDTSATGIGCCSRRAVPAGSLVDLWIEAPGRRGKFFLTGEVRWCRENGADNHAIGIELRPGSATDYVAWREHHASRFGAQR